MPGTDLPSTVQALLDITGDWTPGSGATEQDLADARLAIAHALAAETPAAVPPQRGPTLDAARQLHVDRLAPQTREGIEAGVSDMFRRGQHARSAPIVSVRTGPIPNELSHAGNVGTYGMKASRVLGPFIAADGLPCWVDIFNGVQATSVYSGSSSQPFLIAPFVEFQIANRAEYILGAGSVWMDASLLGAGIQATCWTGFRIKSGKIVFSVDSTSVKDGVRIPADATCELSVELDPPAAPRRSLVRAAMPPPARSPCRHTPRSSSPARARTLRPWTNSASRCRSQKVGFAGVPGRHHESLSALKP